jgi:hypothetical protein
MRVRSERGDALIGLEMTNGHVNGVGIAAKPYTVRLDRQQIVVDPDISTRDASAGNGSAVNYDTVKLYASHYENGVNMPPPEVWLVGERHLLVDGFHRMEALDLIHNHEPYAVEVVLVVGTLEDALLRATEANTTHGRPLTKRDRDKAMGRYLSLSAKSYNEIGRILGVHASTVMRFDQTQGIRAPKKVETAAADPTPAAAIADEEAAAPVDGERREAPTSQRAYSADDGQAGASAYAPLPEEPETVDEGVIELALAALGEIDLAVVAPGVAAPDARRVYQGAAGYSEPWFGRVLVAPAGDYLAWHRKIVSELGNETTGVVFVVPAMPWEGWFVKLTKEARKVAFLKDEPLAVFVHGEYDGAAFVGAVTTLATLWTRVS